MTDHAQPAPFVHIQAERVAVHRAIGEWHRGLQRRFQPTAQPAHREAARPERQILNAGDHAALAAQREAMGSAGEATARRGQIAVGQAGDGHAEVRRVARAGHPQRLEDARLQEIPERLA